MERIVRNAAKALIIKDDKMLAIRISDEKEEWYIMPGGGQDVEELLPDTVCREVAEEMGLQIEVKDLVFVIEGLHEDMKQLIVIVGPNAVGKTTTAKKLIEQYSKNAYVDSDWCRAINPFEFTESTKRIVSDNIYCLLHNYLLCDEINTVVFTYSWHGDRKAIYESVLKRLKDDGIEFQENVVVLKCSEAENRKRAIADGRDEKRVERGMKTTFSFYDEYDYPCIDTTDMTPTDVAQKICELVKSN